MTEIAIPGLTSPFDAIRRLDERGEYWSARDLQPVLGYVEWRKLEDTIDRAIAAISNSGMKPQDHIGDAAKMVTIGSGAQRYVQDYRLTRYGAYLVAMNGDPRKREIAAAQTYFAVKTREAETAPAPAHRLPQSFAEALQLAADQARAIEQQRAQLAITAPKADAWDVLASAHGDYSVREAAFMLNRIPGVETGQQRLFKLLRDWKLIDRQNRPYAAHSRHVRLRARSYTSPNGNERTAEQVRITVEGLRYLRKRLTESRTPEVSAS